MEDESQTTPNNPKDGDKKDKNSKRKQIIVAVAVFCCVGLLFIIMIGGMVSPEAEPPEVKTAEKKTPESKTPEKKSDTAGLTRIQIIDYEEYGLDGPVGIDASITTNEGPYLVDSKVAMPVWEIYHEKGNDPFLAKIEVRNVPPFKNAKVIVEVYDLDGKKL